MARTDLLHRFQCLYRDFEAADPAPLARNFTRRVGASFTNPAQVQSYAVKFLSQLEPVFPGITLEWNGIATLDVPALNPNALGSYSYWKLGQYTLFSGSERERSGNCHFAGEHCSINFQGFMEGGAQEGARAASEILEDYKAGLFP